MHLRYVLRMDANSTLMALEQSLGRINSRAALGHYASLHNKAKNLHALGGVYVSELSTLARRFESTEVQAGLNGDYGPGGIKAPFGSIVSRLLQNQVEVIELCLGVIQPVDRSQGYQEPGGETSLGFEDFSHLLTVSRQAIDSLISQANQLYLLDTREMNYYLLSSLRGFMRFASASLAQVFVRDVDLQQALRFFEGLSANQARTSSVTTQTNRSFRAMVEFVTLKAAPSRAQALTPLILDYYAFTCDGAHVGYVSTLFASRYEVDPIFVDVEGSYSLSSENFAEIRYKLCSLLFRVHSEVFVPSVLHAVSEMIGEESGLALTSPLRQAAASLTGELAVHDQELGVFVAGDAVERGLPIVVECACGFSGLVRDVRHGYVCDQCGSTCRLVVLEGDPGFVRTANGDVRVAGSLKT